MYINILNTLKAVTDFLGLIGTVTAIPGFFTFRNVVLKKCTFSISSLEKFRIVWLETR
jgi:hypothetical protein